MEQTRARRWSSWEVNIAVNMNDDLLSRLTAAAPELDRSGTWPAEQISWLAESGVLKWVIPREYGGEPASAEDLLTGYESLAEACLTTAFVLTQRNGACQRIADSEGQDLKSKVLPGLAAGELFATVGISHLTTSRQHLRQPAVRAVLRGNDVVLSGTVPWVTGAGHAAYTVTGGTLADGRQVLVAIPMLLRGVRVQPAATLLALTASQTASIELTDVVVPRSCILAGPVEGVMNQGRGGGTGSVTTSALAAGVTRRAVAFLQSDGANRPELQEFGAQLRSELEELQRDLRASASDDAEISRASPSAVDIRRRANSLVLRATQAQLAASKGAGFVAGHPAERAVREAMFFLVWSCPQPVLAAALREFARIEDDAK
jgi:alkylation response protein AidB-like acyl-CoA dehydrogenase